MQIRGTKETNDINDLTRKIIKLAKLQIKAELHNRVKNGRGRSFFSPGRPKFNNPDSKHGVRITQSIYLKIKEFRVGMAFRERLWIGNSSRVVWPCGKCAKLFSSELKLRRHKQEDHSY